MWYEFKVFVVKRLQAFWRSEAGIRCRILLIDLVPAYRRRFVLGEMRSVNENVRFNYLKRWKGPRGQVPEGARELTFLVSSESDHRYEWLELAIREHGLPGRLVYMPQQLFQVPYLHYMKRYLKGETTHIDLDLKESQPSDYDRCRERLAGHLERILAVIREEYQPSALVTASLGDARWRETIKVARSVGLPCVVTEREGVKVPAVLERCIDLDRRALEPDVDLMCTVNSQHTEYWEKVGVGADGRITLTGDLKVDIWNHPGLWPTRTQVHPDFRNDACLIVYFAFGKRNYIEERVFPGERKDWTPLQSDHYSVLRNIADRYGDRAQIVIKGARRDDFSDFLDDPELFDRKVVFSLDGRHAALDLIVNADVIIGFQSTAMIESMFTDRPVLYPAWGELHDRVVDDLIPLHQGGAVDWIRSKDEFERTLGEIVEDSERFRASPDVMASRKRFRETYYHEPAGSAGLRTYQAIESCTVGD